MVLELEWLQKTAELLLTEEELKVVTNFQFELHNNKRTKNFYNTL
jgi:hypothetical protein